MKTGDSVKHGPTGETWLVAYVEGDYLAWCGWPEGEAKVADCTLVRECSEEESIEILRDMANISGPSRRQRYAEHRLRELGLLPALPPTVEQKLEAAAAERDRLLVAIVEHHAQKADDRCIEDDDRLYAAAGLPPCDRRVGDKAAMLANCARFIERRCESGDWRSYADLEALIRRATLAVEEDVRDYEQGLCIFCGGIEHAKTCPWPEMVEVTKG